MRVVAAWTAMCVAVAAALLPATIVRMAGQDHARVTRAHDRDTERGSLADAVSPFAAEQDDDLDDDSLDDADDLLALVDVDEAPRIAVSRPTVWVRHEASEPPTPLRDDALRPPIGA